MGEVIVMVGFSVSGGSGATPLISVDFSLSLLKVS